MKSHSEYRSILEQVVSTFGGEIIEEVQHEGIHDLYDHGAINLPRWVKYFDGGMIMFDFFESNMYRLEVTIPPPHLLEIKPHSLFTRILGGSAKTGVQKFDKSYCVQNTTEEIARKTLASETVARLDAFHPFMLFELSVREYRIHKQFKLKYDFHSTTAIADIERFAGLVTYIHSNIWGQEIRLDLESSAT